MERGKVRRIMKENGKLKQCKGKERILEQKECEAAEMGCIKTFRPRQRRRDTIEHCHRFELSMLNIQFTIFYSGFCPQRTLIGKDPPCWLSSSLYLTGKDSNSSVVMH
jgi:hypothetical protein